VCIDRKKNHIISVVWRYLFLTDFSRNIYTVQNRSIRATGSSTFSRGHQRLQCLSVTHKPAIRHVLGAIKQSRKKSRLTRFFMYLHVKKFFFFFFSLRANFSAMNPLLSHCLYCWLVLLLKHRTYIYKPRPCGKNNNNNLSSSVKWKKLINRGRSRERKKFLFRKVFFLFFFISFITPTRAIHARLAAPRQVTRFVRID